MPGLWTRQGTATRKGLAESREVRARRTTPPDGRVKETASSALIRRVMAAIPTGLSSGARAWLVKPILLFERPEKPPDLEPTVDREGAAVRYTTSVRVWLPAVAEEAVHTLHLDGDLGALDPRVAGVVEKVAAQAADEIIKSLDPYVSKISQGKRSGPVRDEVPLAIRGRSTKRLGVHYYFCR